MCQQIKTKHENKKHLQKSMAKKKNKEALCKQTANEHIGRLARMMILDTEVDGSNPDSSMLFP